MARNEQASCSITHLQRLFCPHRLPLLLPLLLLALVLNGQPQVVERELDLAPRRRAGKLCDEYVSTSGLGLRMYRSHIWELEWGQRGLGAG
jgi:hypothetical protein